MCCAKLNQGQIFYFYRFAAQTKIMPNTSFLLGTKSNINPDKLYKFTAGKVLLRNLIT